MGTFPAVMRICFPDLPYTVNKTDFIVTLPNGSEIWFGGLDNPKSAEKILGNEFSTIYPNEISEIDYTSLNILLTRLAEKNSLTKKVYYDMNPPSKGHWSYLVFIKKINPIDNEPLGNPDDYDYIIMNPMDNLENIDENYISLLEKMPEKERQRFLLGEFSDDSEGQAYYAFDRDRHVKTFTPFNTPFMYGTDFNVSPMTSIIFQVVNGIMFVYDEIWLKVGDTPRLVDTLKRSGYKGGYLYPDSTGKNRKTSGRSDFQILKEAGYTIKSIHNPLQRDRVVNVNRLFTNDQIIINSRCKKLIADLEQVTWKDNKLHEGTEKQLTHISDCLGYPTWQIFPMNTIIKRSYSETK